MSAGGTAARVERTGAILGSAGALVWLLIGQIDPAHAFQGLLGASVWLIAFPVGAIAVLSAHALTGGRWGGAVAPPARAVLGLMPFALAPYLLMLAGAREILFPWTAPFDTLHEIVRNKAFYLNEPFFAVRFGVYLVAWLALARALGREDRAVPAGLAAAGLILFLLTVTYFGFDWLMSLQPEWYSDIFGLMLCAEFLIATAALAIFVGWYARPEASAEEADALADAASLLFVVCLGWAALAFLQYLIIWMTNLPDEILYYLARGGGWVVLDAALWALWLGVPLLVLSRGALKRRRRTMLWAAGAILGGHLARAAWLAMPPFSPGEFSINLAFPAAVLGLGGFGAAILARRLARARATADPIVAHDETAAGEGAR
ncbi:MAG: hypothetical protein ACFBWO_12340 [Paracoccaceae bacterium]